MVGEGKYDDACTQARLATGGESVMLVVINGRQGHGFSVHSTDPQFPEKIPLILREMADSIEKEVARNRN